MNSADQYYLMAADVAAQAIAKAKCVAGANVRLNRALGPFMPALRRAAANEHAGRINSFVNESRIDITVEVHLSGGDVVAFEAGQ